MNPGAVASELEVFDDRRRASPLKDPKDLIGKPLLPGRLPYLGVVDVLGRGGFGAVVKAEIFEVDPDSPDYLRQSGRF